MPLHVYGLVAAVLFTWQLALVKNVLTIGGSAVLGFGVGLVIGPLANSILRKLYTNAPPEQFLRKTVLVIVGFLSAEVVNTMILAIVSLLDSEVRTRILTMGLENLAVVVHVPVVFWLLYLWVLAFMPYNQVDKGLSEKGYRPKPGERSMTKDEYRKKHREERVKRREEK